MSAGVYKMTCNQGANLNQSLTWRNPDGTPINLTGYTAEMRVARNKGGTLVLNPTTENGDIVITGLTGNVQINVSAADTADVEAGIYVYEVDLTANNGTVTRLLEGQFVVDGRV